MRLSIKQTQAIDFLEDKVTNELLFGGGAGGGKSVLGSYFLMKNAYKYEGSRWLMGRANMKTLKETTYVSFLKVAKLQKLVANRDFIVTSAQHKEYPNCILFPNKSVILMKDLMYYPSDPEFDDLGSLELTGGFIDEANQCTTKARSIVRSRCRHNITQYGLVPKMLYSCNPAKNWVYHDFYKPDRDGVLGEKKKFIQSLVTDNKYIDPTYIESLQSLPKASKERLLHGNWEYDDDPATLIDYDKIISMFSNTFAHSGGKYITGDIARFGSDSVVVIVWDGLRAIRVVKRKKQSITDTAKLILELAQQYQVPISNICVDEDGVGGGVVDILGCKGFVNNSRPFLNPITRQDENYQNLKAQCYYWLAKYINDAKIYVSCDEDDKELIIQELEQVKQDKMDKDTKKAILPKEKVKQNIGRSPDFSDALMIRMYFELSPKRAWLV